MSIAHNHHTNIITLSLSKTYLPTKGSSDSDGPKRTIGFMGVGFKAVREYVNM